MILPLQLPLVVQSILQFSPALQVQPLVQSSATQVSTWAQPVVLLQLSTVHSTPSSQSTAPGPAQLPPAQTSPLVHASPSLQLAVVLVCTQPVPLLQLSAVQALLSLQSRVLLPPQLPPLQTSPAVQASPSLQLVVLLVKTQPLLGLQLSLVQPLPSLHVTALAPLQAPPPQTSLLVQALPSSQLTVLGV